jgi:hypothetical protein
MNESEESPLRGGLSGDDEAALRKGRAGSLVVLVGLAVAAVAGLVLLVGGEDEARVYGELGKKINGLERAHFGQFWGCALQGANVADLRSNAELTSQVNGRGLERGRNYGLHVRNKCLPLLQDINPQLDTLIVPDDLSADVEAMKKATSELRGAWSEYVTYLDDPELEYSEDKALPKVTHIARGWYEFKKAHGAINKTIKARLRD